MKVIIKLIERFLEAGAVLTLAAISLVVGLQVIGRYIFHEPPFWTEEVSRFLFLYMIAFGAGLAVKYKGYVNLDVVSNLLPAGVQKVLAFIVNLIVLAFMVMFFMESMSIVDKVQFQRSPVLGISMSFPYASLLGISGTVILFLLIDMWDTLRNWKGGNAS